MDPSRSSAVAAPTQANSGPVIAAAALSTVACVFPGLASGALAVQASADFGVSEGTYGWALGSFFIGAAVMSVPLGKLAQRLGPRRQLSIGLIATALVQLSIATVVPNFAWMLVMLAAAGVINSGVQTAVNLALSQASLPRLGLAIATKQSAMPASAMIGGLAVPLIALTFGWRWAYVLGAAMAAVGWLMVQRFIRPGAAPASASTEQQQERVVESSRAVLRSAALVSFLLAFSSGAINAWTVSSGVDAGLSEGAAGLLISTAAASGIAMRLLVGSRIDASTAPPFRSAAVMYLVGIAGFVMLSFRVPGLHAVASVLAFAGGWNWPVFTNFAIVSANPRSTGSATGLTQTGVYIGVFSAPILTGRIIDSAGYSTMWLVVAGIGVVAGLGAWILSPSFPRSAANSS